MLKLSFGHVRYSANVGKSLLFQRHGVVKVMEKRSQLRLTKFLKLRKSSPLFAFSRILLYQFTDKMWTCPLCNQDFLNPNKAHTCSGNVALAEILKGKSEYTLSLFEHFVTEYRQIGEVTMHAGKGPISLAARKRIVYISRLGKNFMDVVFRFKEAYTDNLCFNKINQIAGRGDYFHHLRIYFKEDINDELRLYMAKAYRNGC